MSRSDAAAAAAPAIPQTEGRSTAAMRQARYEIVEDDGAFYGDIPAIPGVMPPGKSVPAYSGVDASPAQAASKRT